MPIVRPGEGEDIRNPVGGDATVLLRGEHTSGTFAALEVVIAPGTGPPLHIHPDAEESIYVLEGDMRWRLGDEVQDTPPGSLVFVPRGVPHCFQNAGERPGRMLVMFLPSGMEGFFDLMRDATGYDPEAFRRAAAEVGMEVVGPPLG